MARLIAVDRQHDARDGAGGGAGVALDGISGSMRGLSLGAPQR